MRRGWLFVALGIVVLVGVWAKLTMFTSLTKYRELLLEPSRGKFIPADEWARLPSRFHRTPGDCVRYPAPVGQTDSAALSALEAGFSPDELSGLLAVFLDTADLHEDAAHAKSALDEGEQLLLEHHHLGTLDQLVIALNRHRLDELDQATRRRTHAEAARELAALSADQRRALGPLFERNALALSYVNLPVTLTQMRRDVTERRLDALAGLISQSAARTGKLPEDAQALAALVPDEKARKDGWAAPIAYAKTASGAQLTSLGADLKPGGKDLDADVVRQVSFSAGGAGGVPTFSVSRQELEAAFSGKTRVDRDAALTGALDLRGQPEGLRIEAIKAKSLFAQAGLVNGDVVVGVNGLPVDTPEHVLAAFNVVKRASEVMLDVRRGGALRSLRVRAK